MCPEFRVDGVVFIILRSQRVNRRGTLPSVRPHARLVGSSGAPHWQTVTAESRPLHDGILIQQKLPSWGLLSVSRLETPTYFLRFCSGEYNPMISHLTQDCKISGIRPVKGSNIGHQRHRKLRTVTDIGMATVRRAGALVAGRTGADKRPCMCIAGEA
jgi:hypothetical protein